MPWLISKHAASLALGRGATEHAGNGQPTRGSGPHGSQGLLWQHESPHGDRLRLHFRPNPHCMPTEREPLHPAPASAPSASRWPIAASKLLC